MADMQKQLDALQAEQAEIGQKLASLPGPGDGSVALPEDRPASMATDEEIAKAQVIRDPWSGQDALKILRHPPGKHLQWICPNYRERRGMRGWNPVRYDDAIGRELDKYITEPPSRMEGLIELGDVVRRGDVVLAWIDEGIYNARIQQGRAKAHRAITSNAARGNKKFGMHGQSVGDGLQDDQDPGFRRRYRKGLITPRTRAEYEARAQGSARNLEDSQVKVEGRRLFGDDSE